MTTTTGMRVDLAERLGGYETFELDELSYYPTPAVQTRLRGIIYGTSDDGLANSQKWNEEETHISFHRPFAHCNVEGQFLLFLPKQGPAFGMMHLRSVNAGRQDLNLSIVSPVALAPHRLHNVETRNNYTTFYVVDEEGSSWSLHSKKDWG